MKGKNEDKVLSNPPPPLRVIRLFQIQWSLVHKLPGPPWFTWVLKHIAVIGGLFSGLLRHTNEKRQLWDVPGPFLNFLQKHSFLQCHSAVKKKKIHCLWNRSGTLKFLPEWGWLFLKKQHRNPARRNGQTLCSMTGGVPKSLFMLTPENFYPRVYSWRILQALWPGI